MMGGVRGEADAALVEGLKKMARDLEIADRVQFVVGQPREEILAQFSKAKVGIHTMQEEHFGIAIVEMMSAGLITLAHSSGGPLQDIIGNCENLVGHLCRTEGEFAE